MPRPKLILSVLIIAILIAGTLTVASAPPRAGSQGPAYVPDELIVKFKSNATAIDHASERAALNALKVRGFRSGAEHWKLGPGHSVEQAIAHLKANKKVQY